MHRNIHIPVDCIAMYLRTKKPAKLSRIYYAMHTPILAYLHAAYFEPLFCG